jgi:hypothetical protein
VRTEFVRTEDLVGCNAFQSSALDPQSSAVDIQPSALVPQSFLMITFYLKTIQSHWLIRPDVSLLPSNGELLL